MKSKDPMKSHFCITLWKWNGKPITELIEKEGYLNFDPIIDKMIEVGRMCRMHYGCWSVEDSRLKNTVEPATAPLGDKSPVSSKMAVSEYMDKIRKKMLPGEIVGDSAEVASGTQDAISSVTDGGVHIHYYIELNRTIRWSTVVNKFTKNGFDGVHVEVRRGWRETCREYHMGVKNYSDKPDKIISGEWGKWREDLGTSYSKEDYFELAAQMILAGYNPSQVARRFPTWYIRHGYGIERLYNALNRDEWNTDLY